MNLYAYILETEYDQTVSQLFLAVVHPDLPQGRCIEVPRLDAEIGALVENEIACGRAGPATPGELTPLAA